MGIINHSGDIPLAVALQFKGDQVGNPMSSDAGIRDFRYIIANESVSRFEITANLGGTDYAIRRQAGRGQRFFDEALNCYTTSPFSGAVLDRLLDPANTPTWRIDLTFTFRSFFDKALEWMTREGTADHNLASPDDEDAVLATFTRSTRSGVRITYSEETKRLQNVPVTLADKEVTPQGSGQPPAVKLVFELDFLTGIDDTKKEAMRKLLAMDWSKLARYGSQTTSETYVDVWDRNVMIYLINHTDLNRGEEFRQKLVNDHKTKTAEELSTDLRNGIDELIITANHWGQAREDETTERLQRYVSDLFGTLHQSTWRSSPVHFLRWGADILGLSYEQQAALALQYGAGHCGEHAMVSFSVLKDIIDASGSQVSFVVFTGNANIDHAFVVYDLDVPEVIQTVTTASNNTRLGGAGHRISVWNLRSTIEANRPDGREGFVMDPYLAPNVQKPKASQLLYSISHKRAKPTDFLAFDGEHPTSPAPRRLDITGRSAADRARLVPNV